MAMTVRELLYFAIFPEDPIADWSKAQVTVIIEKYKQKLAIYDKALLQHKYPYFHIDRFIEYANFDDVRIELQTKQVRMFGSHHYGTVTTGYNVYTTNGGVSGRHIGYVNLMGNAELKRVEYEIKKM
jgi:hypothetical protein